MRRAYELGLAFRWCFSAIFPWRQPSPSSSAQFAPVCLLTNLRCVRLPGSRIELSVLVCVPLAVLSVLAPTCAATEPFVPPFFYHYVFTINGHGSQKILSTYNTDYGDKDGNVTPCTQTTTITHKWQLVNIGNYGPTASTASAYNVGHLGEESPSSFAYVLSVVPAVTPGLYGGHGVFSETVEQSGSCPALADAPPTCGTYTWTVPILHLPLSAYSAEMLAYPNGEPTGGGQPCEYEGGPLDQYISGPPAGESANLLRYCDPSLECKFPSEMTVHGSQPRSYCQQSLMPVDGCEPPPETSSAEGVRTWKDQSDNWQLKIRACEQSPEGADNDGLKGLSADFVERLHRLFEILMPKGVCVRLTIAYRTYVEQQRLYTEWHDITDASHSEHLTPTEICEQLAKAKLAQVPLTKGTLHYPREDPTHHCDEWSGKMEYEDGKAKGGPAEPGRSRHESGEAADFKVLFPPRYTPDWQSFRKAAREASLCGPSSTDQVHVQMPPIRRGSERPCVFGAKDP